MTERQCGSCTLCCRLLPVPDLNKPSNVRCQHQRATGCRVYHKPALGFPRSCEIWNCRWLVGAASGLRRPDHVHYVIDIMPDLIRVTNRETGEVSELQAIQVWVDPAYPDAWRDPALAAYAEGEGEPLIIRHGAGKGLVAIPPALNTSGDWVIVDSGLMPTKTGSALIDKLIAEEPT